MIKWERGIYKFTYAFRHENYNLNFHDSSNPEKQ